jgi:hypothetical protein
MTSRLAIYNGRNLFATIALVRKRFEARDAKHRLIGRFKSEKRAIAAIDKRIKACGDG